MSETRILVVEDEDYIQTDLYGPLSEDVRNRLFFAGNETDAINALNATTFDVAFVDIHLRTKDLRNCGGIDVIRHIHVLNEGTSVIAVSGTPSTDAMHQTYESQVDGFLLKKKVRTQDLSLTLEGLRAARAARAVPRFGNFGDIIGLLSHPDREPAIWDRNLSDFLGSSVPIVRDILTDATSEFLPLLRAKVPFPTDGRSREGRSWSETLWSKGLGKPIRLELTATSGSTSTTSSAELGTQTMNVLLARRSRGLECAVFAADAELPRELFDDSIWKRQPVKPSSASGPSFP